MMNWFTKPRTEPDAGPSDVELIRTKMAACDAEIARLSGKSAVAGYKIGFGFPSHPLSSWQRSSNLIVAISCRLARIFSALSLRITGVLLR
jgi:hypothetical protein